VPHTSLYNQGEFLAELQRGSQAAFARLYNQEFTSVFYFARRFVADSQAAEDITTDTFVKLCERLNDFESIEAIHSFLMVTVKNACLNHLRSVRRENLRYEELRYLLEEDDSDIQLNTQLTAHIFQHIYEEIEKLSPQLKKVFTMSFIEGLSNEEIARQLGINNQSVRNDKSRALRQIRLALSDKHTYSLFLLWLALAKQWPN
jgi:RNA polymerase sigma-70 factor (family 1)